MNASSARISRLSSSGTLVNREVTSQETKTSFLSTGISLISSTKEKVSEIVWWLNDNSLILSPDDQAT